jgi:hypothetical protein
MAQLAKFLSSTAGVASGSGGGLDIDELFSTYLYDGNGTDTDIVNGIDLTEGGLVWIKARGVSTSSHRLIDSAFALSANKYLDTSSSGAAWTGPVINTFNTNGFNLDSNWYGNSSHPSYGGEYVSWTWRKAPRFFDVGTISFNSSGVGSYSHNLGVTPAMVIFKLTNTTGDWFVWHKDLTSQNYAMFLNATSASSNQGGWATYTDTTVSFNSSLFANDTAVVYLFAHNNNDGGFGPDSDQDIIKCGTYSGQATVDLGFEPQWLMVKNASSSTSWRIFDNMRGWGMGDADLTLAADSSSAELGSQNWADITPTGFKITNSNGNVGGTNMIYMAIRRGPLAVPDDATKVFNVNTYSNNGNSNIYNTGFDVDMSLSTNRDGANNFTMTRLTGNDHLKTDTNAAAVTESSGSVKWWDSRSNYLDLQTNWWGTNNAVSWAWKRAPSYFDCVCYSGTGSARTVPHGLTVPPEMIWVKARNATKDWQVYHSGLTSSAYKLMLNNTNAEGTSTVFNATAPTSDVFSLGTSSSGNGSGNDYIAMLFATVPNVSKCGSYTGNGSTQNIDCGFSSGARFVLIKRTSGIGSWVVYDTARGITTSTDPFLYLDSNAAERSDVPTYDIDPHSSGFILGGGGTYTNYPNNTYIFYAIA